MDVAVTIGGAVVHVSESEARKLARELDTATYRLGNHRRASQCCEPDCGRGCDAEIGFCDLHHAAHCWDSILFYRKCLSDKTVPPGKMEQVRIWLVEVKFRAIRERARAEFDSAMQELVDGLEDLESRLVAWAGVVEPDPLNFSTDFSYERESLEADRDELFVRVMADEGDEPPGPDESEIADYRTAVEEMSEEAKEES